MHRRGFEWSAIKAAINLRKHHVAFQDAIEVFDDDRSIIEDNPDRTRSGTGSSG